MKQFKNTLAVAIAVAGLYGVPAMAGTAVHWAGSDAGGTKDVKWKVVQPSTLDFTVTPAQVTSVERDGGVNGSLSGLGGNAGAWRNDGDAVTVKASGVDAGGHNAIARGDSPKEHPEQMFYWFQADVGSVGPAFDLTGDESWPSHSYGKIYAVMQWQDVKSGNWSPVTDIRAVRSTRFTDTLTVTKYTV